MRIDNPIQMNDWVFKKCMRVVFAVQIGMWGSIGWTLLGLDLPVVRAAIGFIFSVYLPGVLILRALRVHSLGSIPTFILTITLSISTIMILGFVMNVIGELFGFDHTFSSISMIASISALVSVLSALCYFRDRGFADPSSIDLNLFTSRPALFMYGILCLAIAGSCIANYESNNVLLLLVLFLVSASAVFIGFGSHTLSRFFPLVIAFVSLSLLLSSSLISEQIWGWDIQIEYYLSDLVLKTGHWNPEIPNSANGMLSVVVLAPFLSGITGLSLTWVFKILYPILFSFVPLGLYYIFRLQTNGKIAFLATYFFMSFFVFFTQMLTVARQEIAELVLIALIVLLLERRIIGVPRSILLIMLSFSLIVSHYSISYFFILALIVMWAGSRWWSSPSNRSATVSGRYVVLFSVLAITWYSYVSSSSAIGDIVEMGKHVGASFTTDLLNPEAAQGLAVIIKETTTPLHTLSKLIYLASSLLIFFGVLDLLSSKSEFRFDMRYRMLSITCFLVMIAAVVVPFFSSSFNTERLYHVTLLFLAPLFITGWIRLARIPKEIRGLSSRSLVTHSLRWVSVFVTVYALFNTGFVYEVANDHPDSFVLNYTMDMPRFNSEEMEASQWIAHTKDYHIVYADSYRWLLLARYAYGEVGPFPDNLTESCYVFVGTFNLVHREILVPQYPSILKQYIYVDSIPITVGKAAILDNGGARVYFG